MTKMEFSQLWYWFLVGAVLSYLFGCFNFAVMISKIKKKDIRTIGSGNPGTMNMTRTFGLKIGLINFLCDGLKGGIPVLVGYFAFRNMVFAGTNVLVSDFTRYLFGVCAVVGHIFPVTMKFRGGKGIASSLGVFWFALACERWWFAFIVVVWFVGILTFIYLCEWGSMGSLLGVSGLTIWQAIIFVVRYQSVLLNGWVIGIFLLLLYDDLLTWSAHHKNLYALMAGEEHRTSVKKMINKHKA
jgi:glycerol-3-phosphate acyltransferase PlsY